MGSESKKSKTKSKSVANAFWPIVIVVIIVIMVTSMIFRGKGSRGSCHYDHVYRKATCPTKQMMSFPEDVNDAALTIDLGTKHDKSENHFTILENSNISRFTHLQELVLIKCGIEEIRPETFASLQNLRRLDLRYNRIQIFNEQTFQGLTILEYLYLSNNPIQAIGDNLFNGLTIDHLVFANNPVLAAFSPAAFAGASVKTLVINRGNLLHIEQGTFQALNESLRELYITHNLQPLSLHKDVFKGLQLDKLILANNGIEESDFLEHVIATEISLDNNPLGDIDFDESDTMRTTQRLSLRNTKLTKLNIEDLDMLVNLQELDLDGNQISILNVSVFKDLDNLKVLDLSDNDLEYFDGDFGAEFPSLKALYLDSNEIQTLPESLMELFSRLENLTLHDNPLHCNCELRWFVKWLEDKGHRSVIQKLESINCETPDQENLTKVSEYGFQCRSPKILNTTFDGDGMGLICTAEGDPPPSLTWMTPSGEEIIEKPSSADRDNFQMRIILTMTKDGNYTCIAENVAGSESVVVNTREMPKSGLKFYTKSQKIKILETPQGFFVTLCLLAVLGYMFKNY